MRAAAQQAAPTRGGSVRVQVCKMRMAAWRDVNAPLHARGSAAFGLVLLQGAEARAG